MATNGVDTRDGKTYWTNAVLTISNAVKKATVVNDLVLVSNGEYIVTAQITISSQITVRSWNNGIVDSTNTIVNGNGVTRCFNISHTGAVVEGLTIYNGNSNGYGGGIYMAAGTLRNCIVVSNSTPNYYGGGIYLFGASLVDNCLIAFNIATNGGGISTPSGGGNMLVTNCVIRNNRTMLVTGSAAGGGGVYMRGAGGTTAIVANCSIYENSSSNDGGGITMQTDCIVKDCVISNNFAVQNGGGVLAYGAGLVTNCVIVTNVCNNNGGGIGAFASGATIANCVIARNSALSATSANNGGGGVYMASGTIKNSIVEENTAGFWGGGIYYEGGTVRNCLIRNNVASGAAGGAGGGLRLYYADLNLMNCTIVSNYAKGNTSDSRSGGGFYSGNQSASYTQRIENCIVYFNTVGSFPAYSNYCVTADRVISFSNSCFAPALSGSTTNYSANNITSDPQFVNKDDGNWRLKKESPCVNAGVNRDWMTGAVDLDRHSRIDKFSGKVDMGCYEYLPSGTIFSAR